MSTPAEQGEQEVRQDRRDAPDRHPRVTEEMVPADGEATLRAGRPTVKKNMSVPQTTAVLRMPIRDTGHIR